MNATATALPTYVKAESNSGTIHLALEGSSEARCATGKVKARVTPLPADEMAKPITCKRCEKLALKIDAERIAAAADTSAIDQLLEEATSVQDITAILEQALAAEATTDPEGAAAMAETAGEVIAEAAAAAPKKGKGKGKAAAAAPQPQAQQPEAAPAAAAPAPRQRLDQAQLVLAYLNAHPGEALTPHEISKAVTPEGAKKLGLRDCCARLAKDGKIAQHSEKPVSYAAILPEDEGSVTADA